VTLNTLRAYFEQLRAQGTTFTLDQTVGFLVPLTVELAQRHAAGEALFVNPSTIVLGDDGRSRIDPALAQRAPSLPRDRACLAPEERSGLPGNARASVYAVGALLYEALTGASVGPGMRRPSDLNPAVPPAIELLLAKALVADPTHRPDDLLALAQALHHLAPHASVAPPPADESHLDGGSDFTVDVSMSMLPPNPMPAASPYDVRVVQRKAKAQPVDDRVVELAALKSRLESDPRPRYVVVKEGMDHGPFSAVELLQQIATHGFIDSDLLRDSLSNDERAIKDWDQFAPFAEQARLHRDIKAEKAALERTVVREQRSTRGKAFFGIIAVGALLAAGVIWYFTARGMRKDALDDVQGEMATNIETDGSLKGRKRVGGGKGGIIGSQGGIPMLSGGMSCEAAQNAYVEEMKIGQRGQADITAGQYGAILNSGQYMGGCGVPDSMAVNICAAIQNGHAVGVSVTTSPPNGRVGGCIAAAVRRINFPAHPKLDVTRTSFAPAK
jgi:eukaryotic-like serine/threonine-protein kinase